MKNKQVENVVSFAFAILIALTIRWIAFESYVIPSASMLPSLLIHDHIFVNKFVYGIRVPFSSSWLVEFKQPSRGEVIVFRSVEDPGIFLIKRIIGVGGDKLRYEDGVLYVNDQKIENVDPEHTAGFDWVRTSDLGGEKEDFDHRTEVLGEVRHSILNFKYGNHRPQPELVVPDGHLFMMGDNRDNSKDSRFFGAVPKDQILGRASIIWLSCNETLPVLSFLCNPLEIRWNRLLHSIN